ncbi:MAG: WGR domain-containing protein [Methylocella sp.]
MNAVYLRRVDPARNMHRFYCLDVQPDLFGGGLLAKEWGRLGAHGRMVAEPYDSEALAAVAFSDIVLSPNKITIARQKGIVFEATPAWRCL